MPGPRQFFRELNGSNCTLGGQTLINFLATESAEADYDTASAVCLAPGGPWAEGSILESVEGGVSTGGWCVEDRCVSKKAESTWRRREGQGFAHVPLVAYKLRRMGYLQARTTLSYPLLGAQKYPPKFCTYTYRDRTLAPDLDDQLKPADQGGKGTIDYWEYQKRLAAWHTVGSAAEIIGVIAGWVGLTVVVNCQLPECADQYSPVDKPAATAIREIAAWSGASCFLDRLGRLQVYDFAATFPGGTGPRPATTLDEEDHKGLVSPTHVCLVGTCQPSVWIPPVPGGPRADPALPYRQPEPGRWQATGDTAAVMVTEKLNVNEAAHPVTERIEIRDYQVTPLMLEKIGKERLAQAAAAAHYGQYSGPATGCQNVQPLKNQVLQVTRRLDWTGTFYRYEMDIKVAKGLPSGGGTSDVGWW